MNEMAGQMWDVFEEQRLVTECNVIEQHEVLMQLPHIAHVRYNRQPHCPRKKAYCEELRYSREPGAVCLHIMNSTGLQEIFEQNAIGNVLAGRKFYRGYFARQSDMRVNVIRVRGLFNP